MSNKARDIGSRDCPESCRRGRGRLARPTIGPGPTTGTGPRGPLAVGARRLTEHPARGHCASRRHRHVHGRAISFPRESSALFRRAAPLDYVVRWRPRGPTVPAIRPLRPARAEAPSAYCSAWKDWCSREPSPRRCSGSVSVSCSSSGALSTQLPNNNVPTASAILHDLHSFRQTSAVISARLSYLSILIVRLRHRFGNSRQSSGFFRDPLQRLSNAWPVAPNKAATGGRAPNPD